MRIQTVAVVSLSSGILGEASVKHELERGLNRLRAYGLQVKFMPNALRGLGYLREHPEARAADLLAAFRDPETDLILCAIGGDDTYRLLPWLFDGDELLDVDPDKRFLGFSDTTINHFMLHKLGLPSLYGQSLLPDICALDPEMLPYTRQCWEELLETGTIREVRPSPLWYESRKSYGPEQLGVPSVAHPDRGFELLQGPPRFSGPILGGCIDSIYDMFDGERYPDMPVLCREYGLFPEPEDWAGRILLLESSEEQPSPEKYRRALEFLKEAGVFSAVSGVLVGKPMDEVYDAEYRRALTEVIDDPELPVLCNLNVGHAKPRCILPFGPVAHVDAEAQRIRFEPWPELA